MPPKLLGKSRAAAVALAAALTVFVPSYRGFEWLFIRYWESEHARAMKFTLWAVERAVPSAFFFSGIVFYFVFQYLQHRLPSNEQMPRMSLILLILATLVVLCFCAFAYELHMLSRFAVKAGVVLDQCR